MYHDFFGPRGLQGTHMDTLKPKNSKSITFTVREGFFTFWAILAHYAPRAHPGHRKNVKQLASFIWPECYNVTVQPFF